MSEKLGDGPIEPQYIEKMNDVARALDQIFNGDARGEARETGFVLLVFPYDEKEGLCNYISNGASRKDISRLFKELIANFEGQPEGGARQ
jgi:hypothetical protein